MLIVARFILGFGSVGAYIVGFVMSKTFVYFINIQQTITYEPFKKSTVPLIIKNN